MHLLFQKNLAFLCAVLLPVFVQAQYKFYNRYQNIRPNRLQNQIPVDPQRIVCDRSKLIQADPNDSKSYKICLHSGGLWMIYTYTCPPTTSFDTYKKKCMADSLINKIEVRTTTTYNPYYRWTTTTSNPLSSPTTVKLSKIVTTHGPIMETTFQESSEGAFQETTALYGGTQTEPSSSSSEESTESYYTHPPHFTASYPPYPFPYPFEKISMNMTTEPSKSTFVTMKVHSEKPSPDKLVTWQTLNYPTTTPVHTSTSRRPEAATTTVPVPSKNMLAELEGSVKPTMSVQSLYSPNKTTSWQEAFSQWKLHQNNASNKNPIRERFPGLRPSHSQI